MNKTIAVFGLLLGLFFGFEPGYARAETVAGRIQANYESRLFTLEPYVQRHYALRMYRMSGNEKYLYPIITDMMVIANLLDRDIEGLAEPAYRRQREAIVLRRFNLDKEKHRKRFEKLRKYPGMAFSLALLANINMIAEVGLLNSLFFPETDKAIDYLKQQDFSEFFLDPDVVEIYSPQLATYVFFLSDLQIADLHAGFTREFKKIFMEGEDDELSDLLYGQKLYGLTHFIIGASRNYQVPVNRVEYQWIYEYFENNIDTILKRATADIIAEVGIAFLLAGDSDHPVVIKTRQAVTAAFKRQCNMIPSTTGDPDLNHGEHRNVLAIMLLEWPDRLYTGPDLKSTRQYQTFWIRNYLP